MFVVGITQYWEDTMAKFDGSMKKGEAEPESTIAANVDQTEEASGFQTYPIVEDSSDDMEVSVDSIVDFRHCKSRQAKAPPKVIHAFDLNELSAEEKELAAKYKGERDFDLNKLPIAGFTLFLGFIIDRMHHYLRKLIGLRSSTGSVKEEVERLQKERTELKEKEEKASKEVKQLQEQVSALTERLKKLKMESEQKDKEIETAESHVTTLQKHSACLLLEYDRLLEDNQNLQAQALGQRI